MLGQVAKNTYSVIQELLTRRQCLKCQDKVADNDRNIRFIHRDSDLVTGTSLG